MSATYGPARRVGAAPACAWFSAASLNLDPIPLIVSNQRENCATKKIRPVRPAPNSHNRDERAHDGRYHEYKYQLAMPVMVFRLFVLEPDKLSESYNRNY